MTPRTTAGELQKIVKSLGQKTLKKLVKHHLHHYMCKARLDRPNDGSRSAGEGLLRITVFPFSRHNKVKWNTFSYIFYLVISSDSINEKVLMIYVHL